MARHHFTCSKHIARASQDARNLTQIKNDSDDAFHFGRARCEESNDSAWRVVAQLRGYCAAFLFRLPTKPACRREAADEDAQAAARICIPAWHFRDFSGDFFCLTLWNK